MARITLYGMFQYDPTLFDEVVLPEGYVKDDLVTTIIRTSGMLFPYHQVPPQLKINIATWFRTRFYDFQQMYAAYTASYNPIENYDRTEEASIGHQEKGQDSSTVDYGRKDAFQHGMSTTVTPNTTTTQTTNVSAFDASDYQPSEQAITAQTGSSTSADSGTDESQASGSDSRTTDYGRGYDDTETRHVHGNIGVTTNQQMISAELEMRMKYDLYAVIASLFEDEFLIQVY